MNPFKPKFTITNRMTAAITRIERARGLLEAAQLSADWVREMGNRALVLEAHHTTHIEGTRLTLDQAERLWKGEVVPEADPDDVRELLNYRAAFKFVSDCLDSGDPITEGMIREIHRKLVEGVFGGSAAPGAYRRIQNYVVNSSTGKVLYTPPSAVEVPIMMSELVKWLNGKLDIHPVLVAVSPSSSWCTSIPFSMVMGVPHGCSPPCACTRPVTTSNCCLRSVNITTATGRPFLNRFKAYATINWI